MAKVRKRAWSTPDGEQKSAWVVDYRDSSGHRRSKQFKRKKDAEAWLVSAAWEVTQGTHTPDSQSITVQEAANQWLDRRRANDLEPTTIAAYEQHIRLHIVPLCGKLRLNQITRPKAEDLRDRLVASVSRPMATRMLRTLTSIVSDAQSRGRVAQNVFEGVRLTRSKREKSAIIIPTKPELRAILAASAASSEAEETAFIHLLVFSGLRASELRGLGWQHIDLKKKTVSVQRRADARGVLGPPKTEAGYRSVPLPSAAISALRRWKLACSRTSNDLVFPSLHGAVMSHAFMTKRLLHPIQVTAGVTEKRSTDENPTGRYTLHDFRHAAASLWIDKGVTAKVVQRWMGHSSIQVTFDTYGHLFASPERDAAIAAEIERDLTHGDDDAAWMLQASCEPLFSAG